MIVEKNNTRFIGENEKQRIVQDQIVGIKGHSVSLTGKTRTVNAVDLFTIGSGEAIRLECGKSVIELTREGEINIKGVNFNFTVEEGGQINTTGGALHLNPIGGAAATIAPGSGHQEKIKSDIDSFFVVNADKGK